jgi:hypothetical protein
MTEDSDPLFTLFLRDFSLEYLDADQRAALRAYLTHLSRKWAEMEACQAFDAMQADPSRPID